MKKAVSMLVAIALSGATYLPMAKAQDLGGALDLPMLGQGLTLSAAIRAQAQRDAALMGKGIRSASEKKTAKRKGSTRFRMSSAARLRNLSQFIASVRRSNPAGAAELQRTFAKGDPIAAMAPGLRRYNLRTDDVADAATAYLVSAWYGVRGRNDDPPMAYVTGLRQQMRGVMLSVPAFVSSSDSTKQQMAEAMLVQTMIADGLVTAAKGNPTLMSRVKSSIAQGVRNSFQLDLATLKLTSKGLHT